MKDHHVQYQLTGPSHHTASANYVPNSAAWEIRKNGFIVGMIFGAVIVLGAIAFTAKRPPGSAPGTPPSQGHAISMPDREADVPSGPRIAAEYAYAIDEQSFLPIRRELGKPVKTGTVIDQCFYITKKIPSPGALTLPEDINGTWKSEMVFSASSQKQLPLQLPDGSWWSESRGVYMPWDTKNESPDQYVFDAVHGIGVPLVKLSKDEYAIANGRPLRRFHFGLCIFSPSRNAFVPLRYPMNPSALWNEAQSEYVAPSGEKFVAETVYSAASDNHQTKETKQ